MRLAEERFNDILDEMYELWKSKQSDYGEDTWKQLGMKMRFSDVWRKCKRLETLIWFDHTIQNKQETVRDTFIDLAVYCILGIMLWDEEEHR